MSSRKPERVRPPNQAPSFFKWAENRPVLSSETIGWSQHDYADHQHPERPLNFFASARPFECCGFYPDYKHDWDLSGRQTRPPPLRHWRPSDKFCLQDTLNKYDINRGYSYHSVPAREQFALTEVPQGVRIRLGGCHPTPAYVCRKNLDKTEVVPQAVSAFVVRVVNRPPLIDSREYSVKQCVGPTNVDRQKLCPWKTKDDCLSCPHSFSVPRR